MVRKIAKWTAPLFETEAGQIHDWDIFMGLVSRLNGKTEQEVERDLVTGWLERFCGEGAKEKCRDIDLEQAWEDIWDKRGPDRLVDILVGTGPYGEALGLNPGVWSMERIERTPTSHDI